MRLLLVEDEKRFGQALKKSLEEDLISIFILLDIIF